MPTHNVSRRLLLGATAAIPAVIGSGARAQSNAPLNVLAHRVHQTVATGTQGGDATAPWARARGTSVQWTTFDTGPLWERLAGPSLYMARGHPRAT